MNTAPHAPTPNIYEQCHPKPNLGVQVHQAFFWNDTLRVKSIGYVFFLAIMMFFAIALLFVSGSDPHGTLVPFQAIYYLMIFGMIVHRVFRGSWTNIMAPDIAFVAFYTLIHFGYLTPHTLGFVPYSSEVFHFEAAIPRTMLIIILGLGAFLIGFELAGPSPHKIAQALPPTPPHIKWCQFGLFLFCFGLSLHVLGIFFTGIGNFLEYGNTVLQNNRVITRKFHVVLLLSWGNRLLLLGLITHMLSSSLRSGRLFQSKIAMYLFFFTIALYILEGDRGPIFMIVTPRPLHPPLPRQALEATRPALHDSYLRPAFCRDVLHAQGRRRPHEDVQ